MADVELWPNVTFLFCAANLAAWYFKGSPLFSWWWIGLVFVGQILMVALALGIAKKVIER